MAVHSRTLYILLTNTEALKKAITKTRRGVASGNEPKAFKEHIKDLEGHYEVGEDPEGLDNANNELVVAGKDLEGLKDHAGDLEALKMSSGTLRATKILAKTLRVTKELVVDARASEKLARGNCSCSCLSPSKIRTFSARGFFNT